MSDSRSVSRGYLPRTPAAAPSTVSPQMAPRPFDADDLSPSTTGEARILHNFSNVAVTAPVQAKLTVGQPGDPYEQEADRIADQVMTMPDPAQAQVQRMQEPEEEELQMKPSGESIQRLANGEEEDELQMKPLGGSIQRMQMPEEEELHLQPLANSIQRMQNLEEEEELQMQPLGDSIQRMQMPEEEEELQMKAADASTQVASPNLETNLNQSKGGGAALDDATRSFIEPRMGFDFSQVRIHNDSQAVQMNEQLGARAFTHGSDIYFGAGQYNPGSNEGKRLLSHELTHVVQQSTFETVSPPVQRRFESTSDRPVPIWSQSEVRAMQRQLRRLGLYRLGIDGRHGPGTDSGLMEAFGDDSWRGLDAATVLARLSAATPSANGQRGERNLRYGELFRDGVLDITLGIGFDETNAHLAEIEAVENALDERSFVQNPSLARQLYQQAGRTLGPSAFGKFFVRQNALTYSPPAGEPREIHVVVRLVTSSTGSEGGESANAFREGMTESDVSFYGGHGRYGSGPDFDRNMSFELLDANGLVEQQIEDYHVLEMVLRDEGRRHGRGAWEQFLWRNRRNRINVMGSNAGNIFMNPVNRHSHEFGARLMYWNLQRTGASIPAETGRSGSLGQATEADPDRRYRLWVFDGCRTQDYVPSIRSTPGLDTQSTDVIASTRSLYWHHIATTLAAFLDSLVAQQSAEQIVRGMDAKNDNQRSFTAQGIGDNPVFR